MSDRASVSVDNEIKGWIDSYAEKKGLKPSEAVDKLLTTAFGRLEALSRYAKATAKAKPKKEPKAKKPKKEKTAKAEKPKRKAAKKQLAPAVQARIDAAAAAEGK